MKLYGGRQIQRYMSRPAERRVESRDAIVWSVDLNSRTARCRIQGTDEYVVAHYPRNWTSLPYYVKPGMAVRIVHKGGIRGYVEITGPGRAIPTAQSGADLPPVTDLVDAILTGMDATVNDDGALIEIANGTYRIDGTVYAFTGGEYTYTLADDCVTAELTLGDDVYLGEGSGLIHLPPPPVAVEPYHYMRVDLLVVGTDGEIDVISSVPAMQPTIPDVPVDHLKVCHVLRTTIENGIEQWQVDAELETRVPADFTISTVSEDPYDIDAAVAWVQFGAQIDGEDKVWVDPSQPGAVTAITVVDQYGMPLAGTYEILLTRVYGTGGLSTSTSSPDWQSGTAVLNISNGNHTQPLYYWRDLNTSPPTDEYGDYYFDADYAFAREICPSFTIKLADTTRPTRAFHVTLWGEDPYEANSEYNHCLQE